ncbi:type II toxin-antitoxin system RelE/ParE family toxin [Candidatus Thiosymbion oneisti]|uniref:type II toxin-antitoxin system RelE/ParE family toxin n=1 Tax=Candidatus Thiosymbion oneisti TaxID=589554 RepID=UPI000B7F099C
MKNVRFDPLAEHELAGAVGYYDDKGPGLGDGLLTEVSTALHQLSGAPFSCPVVYGELRRKPLFRFPYSFIYRIVNHEVQIVAVMHRRRGPVYVAERLRGVDSDG